MNIVLTPLQLQKLLTDAAELGAELVLTRTGCVRSYITKTEAFERYGRKKVKRWINLGLLVLQWDQELSDWRIDRMEIEAVSKSREAMRYL